MADCTLYIDEAGDLGIGKGTDWFILAGILVNKSDEKDIRLKIKDIRSKINVNEIHFRKMVSFEKKSYVVSELSKCNFKYITIIADTRKITFNRNNNVYTQSPSLLLYNHMCRFLIERASWLLRDANLTADIMLSSRGTSRDRELIDYINKLITYKGNNISNRFEKVLAKSASSWDMLQLADVCATSMFNTHQLNGLEFLTPCHTYKLKSHLYRRNGDLLKYGIKYYSDSMIPRKNYFIENSVCSK